MQGRGSGYPTPAGEEAIARFAEAGGPALDATYRGKAAAALLATVLGAASSRPLARARGLI